MKTGPYKRTPKEYLCKSKLCKLCNHWLNPLGNWLEPHPYPEKRRLQAEESWLPNDVWWQLRNPLHNFMHYWIGIVPVGKHGEWYAPNKNGWVRKKPTETLSYWEKGIWVLPYKHGSVRLFGKNFDWYIGWSSRGNFGVAFRRD
jgi:hypothetical protein